MGADGRSISFNVGGKGNNFHMTAWSKKSVPLYKLLISGGEIDQYTTCIEGLRGCNWRKTALTCRTPAFNPTMYWPLALGSARIGGDIRRFCDIISASLSASLGYSNVCDGFSQSVLLGRPAILPTSGMTWPKELQRTRIHWNSMTLPCSFKWRIV